VNINKTWRSAIPTAPRSRQVIREETTGSIRWSINHVRPCPHANGPERWGTKASPLEKTYLVSPSTSTLSASTTSTLSSAGAAVWAAGLRLIMTIARATTMIITTTPMMA